jgi:hypothetical protein
MFHTRAIALVLIPLETCGAGRPSRLLIKGKKKYSQRRPTCYVTTALEWMCPVSRTWAGTDPPPKKAFMPRLIAHTYSRKIKLTKRRLGLLKEEISKEVKEGKKSHLCMNDMTYDVPCRTKL